MTIKFFFGARGSLLYWLESEKITTKDNFITNFHEVIAEQKQRLLLYVIALDLSSILGMDKKYLFCPKYPDEMWRPTCPLHKSPINFLRPHWNLFVIISSNRSGRQPKSVCKTRGCNYIFELLVMGGVSPETCWAIKKHWNKKFYYTVASCWFFLWVLYYDKRIYEHQVYITTVYSNFDSCDRAKEVPVNMCRHKTKERV
jgi:hypothetical protein